MKTHYEVLNIAPDAPVEVIHAVYKALNDEYAQNASQADDIANLNSAYAVLSDSNSRKRYDEILIANSESKITPEIELPKIEVSAVTLNKTVQTKNKKLWIFGTLAITAATVSVMLVLVEKYDVIELAKMKLSNISSPLPLSNNKTNETVKEEASSKPNPIDTPAQSNSNLTVDVKPEKIQSEIEIKPDLDAKKDELDKLLAEEKAKNEALIKEIESQKLVQAEAKKIELEQMEKVEADKLRNDTLAQELEIQRLEQEKVKRIEFERLAEAEKTKQAEIDRLLAAEKVRAEIAAKKAAILQEQEKSMTAIKQKVNQNWKSLVENTDFSLINSEVVAKFKCTIAVTLTSDGKVLDTTVEKSSDYAGFDQIAEKAVNSASPFPITETENLFEEKFKKLTFVFDRNTVSIK